MIFNAEVRMRLTAGSNTKVCFRIELKIRRKNGKVERKGISGLAHLLVTETK
jgi:hypothetical protein